MFAKSVCLSIYLRCVFCVNFVIIDFSFNSSTMQSFLRCKGFVQKSNSIFARPLRSFSSVKFDFSSSSKPTKYFHKSAFEIKKEPILKFHSTQATKKFNTMADAEHPQIACIQMSVTHNKAENIESAKTLIDKLMADMPETKLIVLPECWNSPYGTQYFREYSDPIPGVGAASAECSPSIAVLLMAAKDHNVHIIGGSIPEIDSDEKVYNTCVVCGPDGTIVAKHRKVHLFDIDIPGKIRFMESDVLTAGDAITTFDTEAFGMIGVGICYDLRFPEFAASMREKGAKVLVYPGAFNMTTGPLHWELLQRARAVDNQCFVVTTAPARVNDGGYCSWGHSTIVERNQKMVMAH